MAIQLEEITGQYHHHVIQQQALIDEVARRETRETTDMIKYTQACNLLIDALDTAQLIYMDQFNPAGGFVFRTLKKIKSRLPRSDYSHSLFDYYLDVIKYNGSIHFCPNFNVSDPEKILPDFTEDGLRAAHTDAYQGLKVDFDIDEICDILFNDKRAATIPNGRNVYVMEDESPLTAEAIDAIRNDEAIIKSKYTKIVFSKDGSYEQIPFTMLYKNEIQKIVGSIRKAAFGFSSLSQKLERPVYEDFAHHLESVARYIENPNEAIEEVVDNSMASAFLNDPDFPLSFYLAFCVQGSRLGKQAFMSGYFNLASDAAREYAKDVKPLLKSVYDGMDHAIMKFADELSLPGTIQPATVVHDVVARTGARAVSDVIGLIHACFDRPRSRLRGTIVLSSNLMRAKEDVLVKSITDIIVPESVKEKYSREALKERYGQDFEDDFESLMHKSFIIFAYGHEIGHLYQFSGSLQHEREVESAFEGTDYHVVGEGLAELGRLVGIYHAINKKTGFFGLNTKDTLEIINIVYQIHVFRDALRHPNSSNYKTIAHQFGYFEKSGALTIDESGSIKLDVNMFETAANDLYMFYGEVRRDREPQRLIEHIRKYSFNINGEEYNLGTSMKQIFDRVIEKVGKREVKLLYNREKS
ncbi:MAG: hypothetical protein ABIG89_07625 [Candidatus Woesearchaeota archaeon]